MKRSDDLPPFDPQEQESITSIPSRFLLAGLLHLDAEGRWWVDGERIEHRGACLFLQKQLRRTAEGSYWVVNGPQRVLVEMEDAPYRIREVHWRDGEAWLRLSDESEEMLDPASLRLEGEDRLYAMVKRGKAGALEGEGHQARFSREALAQVGEALVEEEGEMGFLMKGRFYRL
jgi:hypothetical protein